MKRKSILFVLLLSVIGIFLNSCIRDEGTNIEADIETATIPNASVLLQEEAIIENNKVTFKLKEFSGSYLFAPEFTLSPGATISPASGTLLDFSTPQKYIVTSENGLWKKEYLISFVVDDKTSFIHLYSFENVETIDTTYPDGHFHKFFELINNQKKYDWATANEGYNTLAKTLLEKDEEFTPAVYPTSQITDGYKGKGVKLQTKSTGILGNLLKSPLASGNIFLGNFKQTLPIIKSTKFGIPYHFKSAPKMITGYFKYSAGKTMTKTNPSNLNKDAWDAYAILFEKSDNENFLYGDHAFKNPKIISIARLNDAQRVESDTWTKFEIPFEFVNGKAFDSNKEYMYTIVFTSSIEGDVFNGAVGSTLYIDEVQIITQ